MKKRLYLLAALMLSLFYAVVMAIARAETTELLLPKNMPESYLQYVGIESANTNGVTFVISDAYEKDDELHIQVMQLPNDADTALIDNQVDGDPDFGRAVQKVSQYGDVLLGTLCDISTVTDEQNNSLLNEYRVSCERDEAALIYEFTVYLQPEDIGKAKRIELIFGVNEDLNCRFPKSDTALLILSPAGNTAGP